MVAKQAKGKVLTHPGKFDEVGLASEKGQRFTDRPVLGKSNVHARITSLTVFLDRERAVVAGLACVYDQKKKGGEFVRRDREVKDQYDEQSLSCGEGEFIRSISGTLTADDKLESLNVVTSSGQSKRFGEAATTRKAFVLDIAADEAPSCIFGSLLNFKQPGQREHSIIEHFGVELSRDKH